MNMSIRIRENIWRHRVESDIIFKKDNLEWLIFKDANVFDEFALFIVHCHNASGSLMEI